MDFKGLYISVVQKGKIDEDANDKEKTDKLIEWVNKLTNLVNWLINLWVDS